MPEFRSNPHHNSATTEGLEPSAALASRSGSSHKPGSGLAKRLAFFKGLQGLNGRIHATQNIDEIIFEVSNEACALFEAERITIYLVDETGHAIVSRIKTGLHVVKSIRLPISDKSIAGFCALHRRVLNIRNVYDPVELRLVSPNIEFRREVDERSGFHCRQMLVAPLVVQDGDRLLGVIQLMNTLDGGNFSSVEEEGDFGACADFVDCLCSADADRGAAALQI